MSRHKKESVVEAIFDGVDIFSEPSRIFFKGKRILSTTFGGILSLLLVVFVLYQVSTQFSSMLNYESPNLYQISELEDNPTMIKLDQSSNFVFAVYILLDGSAQNLTKASPFNWPTTYNIYYNYANGTKKRVKYPVLWAPCQATDFPSNIYGPNAFTRSNLNYGYCMSGINYTSSIDGSCPDDIIEEYPDCITPPNFEIGGDYNAEEFRFIQANVIQCDPNDPTLPKDMTCTTQNMSQIFQKQVYNFDIVYTYSLMKLDNHESPNKTVLDNYYWAFNPKIYKVSNIFYDKITMQDLDDFVNNQETNRSYYSASPNKIRDLESFTTGATDTYLQFNIRRSSLNSVVSRTYTKVTDILADLGGFTKTLMFAAAFLAIGYVRYKYLMMVANELYDYKFPEIADDPKKDSAHSRKKLIKNQINNNASQSMLFSIDCSIKKGLADQSSFTSPRCDDASNKNVVEYNQRLKAKKERLRHSEVAYFSEVLGSLCCRKKGRERYALAQKARDKVLYDLDIIKIVRKLQQFDKLQSILLNVYQREALQFIEKPMITLHSKKPLHRDSLTKTILAAHRRESQMLSALNALNPQQPKKRVSLFAKLARGDTTKLIGGDTVTRDSPVLSAITPGMSTNTLTNFFMLEEKAQKDNDLSSLQKFGRLYVSYRYLQDDREPSNEMYNKKLLGMLDPQLMKVFRRMDQLLERDASPEQFEDAVKQIISTKDE